MHYLFNTDTKSSSYGELRPVIIDSTTPEGWTGRHAIQGVGDVLAVRHASWSRSQWTLEGRPNNDRLHFLALTLRARAVATIVTYQPMKIMSEEWKMIHAVIDWVDQTPRPDMTTADEHDVVAYLNTMNELRSNLENVRMGLDIRHEIGAKEHGTT